MSLFDQIAGLGRQYNKTILPMKYNGYTIEPAEHLYRQGFQFYKGTIDSDNVRWEPTIEGAKSEIDEKCWEDGMNVYRFNAGSHGFFSVFGESVEHAMANLEEMINSKDYRLITITK